MAGLPRGPTPRWVWHPGRVDSQYFQDGVCPWGWKGLQSSYVSYHWLLVLEPVSHDSKARGKHSHLMTSQQGRPSIAGRETLSGQGLGKNATNSAVSLSWRVLWPLPQRSR